jgi:hypothetical protein
MGANESKSSISSSPIVTVSSAPSSPLSAVHSAPHSPAPAPHSPVSRSVPRATLHAALWHTLLAPLFDAENLRAQAFAKQQLALMARAQDAATDAAALVAVLSADADDTRRYARLIKQLLSPVDDMLRRATADVGKLVHLTRRLALAMGEDVDALVLAEREV